MFDATVMGNTSTKINVNAVSGILVKNYKESFMIRFGMGSVYEGMLFNKDPEFYKRGSQSCTEPVVVIQVMILPDSNYLAEVMYVKDFCKIFESEGYNGRSD